MPVGLGWGPVICSAEHGNKVLASLKAVLCNTVKDSQFSRRALRVSLQCRTCHQLKPNLNQGCNNKKQFVSHLTQYKKVCGPKSG